MQANYKEPKIKTPRGWKKLREDEREELFRWQKETLDELVRLNLDHEEAELQKIWLKLGCIANYEVFGAGGIRARRWLLKWKRIYRIISQFKTAEERDAYINARMEKIFGKDGYPSEWVDSLENEGKR